MGINTQYFLSLFLLICIFNNKLYTTANPTFIDLTDPKTNNIYGDFNGTAFNCIFQYSTLITDILNPSLYNSKYSDITITFLQSNTTSLLIRYRIKSYGVGAGTAEINYLSDGTIYSHTINYVCQAPPSDLDFEILNDGKIVLPLKEGKLADPFFLLKVKNYTKSIPLNINFNITSTNDKYSMISLTTDTFYYTIGLKSTIYTGLNISIYQEAYKDNVKTFNLKPAMEKSQFNNGVVKDIRFFPLDGSGTNATKSNYLHMFSVVEFEKNKDSLVYFKDTIEFQVPMVLGNLTHSTFYTYFYPFSALTPTKVDFNIYQDTGVQNISINVSSSYYSKTEQSIPVSLNNLNEYYTFTLSGSNNTNPTNIFFSIKGHQYYVNHPYPYGFISGYGYKFNKAVELKLTAGGVFQATYQSLVRDLYLPATTDSEPPKLLSLKSKVIPGSHKHLIIAEITDNLSGFYSIEHFGTNANLVSGTILNGVYEFVVDLSGFDISLYSTTLICDIAFNCKEYNFRDFVNINLDKLTPKYLNLSDVIDVRFEYNDIDVSKSGFNNRLFIKTNTVDKELHPIVHFNSDILSFLTSVLVDHVESYSGSYDELLGCYSIPFYIPKNCVTGSRNYYLLSETIIARSSMLQVMYGAAAELRVKSKYGDQLGPIVKEIKTQRVATTTTVGGSLTWLITIEDTVNGFKSGNITFISDYDLVRYNFTFDSTKNISGDQYTGQYRFDIPLHINCRNQIFYIYYLEMVDTSDRKSIYQVNEDPSYSLTYAMMNFMNATESSMIQSQCLDTKLENLAPTIGYSFTQAIDVTSKSNRTISFLLSASDTSGMNNYSTPRVYLQDGNFNIIHQDFIVSTINDDSTVYYCSFTVPYGFGIGSGISFSFYGIVDNQGNMVGYGPADLSAKEGSFIKTDSTLADIILLSSNDIVSTGSTLMINGRNFINGDIVVIDYNNGTINELSTSYISSTVLTTSLGQINQGVNKIVINIKRTDTLQSDQITVNVQHIKYPSDQDDSSNQDSSSPSSSSNEVIPTNEPQKCINNCNGNGQCTEQGCKCNPPWIGLYCSSKIIVIKPPNVNTTNPETSIIIPKENQDQQNEPVFYAIISVVAVNELDDKGNLVHQYPLTKWTSVTRESKFKQYTDTSYFYNTSITSNNDQSITNISVSIDYFGSINEPVNITFADQILTMNPYSLKYSVDLSQYSFSSSLNSLQLILSASLESKENNECSSIQTGNTVESESEFIKMQVNDHSLYGRFIKRGIVDGRIKLVTNTPLNTEYKSTSSKSQTHIGINIPFYKQLAQIDPDFSVLVDNRAVNNNDENSICKSSSPSKLTAGQIAGIVVGGVVFLFIIAALTVYFLSRKGTSSMAVKLRKIL